MSIFKENKHRYKQKKQMMAYKLGYYSRQIVTYLKRVLDFSVPCLKVGIAHEIESILEGSNHSF